MADPLLAALAAIDEDGRLATERVAALYLPPSPVATAALDPPLPPPLAAALGRLGAGALWRHQAEALAALRRGENVLVTTPTASGKSLVFQLPVLEEALAGGPGRALFLYPLKALGQDQRGKFEALAREAGLDDETAGAAIYDGDTPEGERRRIKRRPPRVVVSNPDMLHLGILGGWRTWAPFLGSLRWIVLDELHTYRGIFGSHFHHVLARLLRLCRHCRGDGGEPLLVASSATAVNAGEFAEILAGRPFHWVRESGSPREGRHFLLFRPGASPYTTTLRLLALLLRSGLKTIVFTKARRITELLYSWLSRQEPALARRVASYRSGFLPEERRRIEADLFGGRLDGVISTSALEMGVDIGGLDACILVGYPGSVMATWQRSGRVGRSGRESLTALVALPDALDQYFLAHPEAVVGRPCERLVTDPANEPVTRAHLVCAAAELPLAVGLDRQHLERHAAVVGALLREHQLIEDADSGELRTRRRRPQRGINLRGTGDTFAILAERADRPEAEARVVGTVDGVRAFHECHPGAVYLHAGRQYLVRALDLAGRRALAVPVRLDYFTTPLIEKDTEVLEVLEEREEGPLVARLARLRVTERVVGFERKRLQGQELLDQQPLELPPVEFETVGLWWRAGREVEETLRARGEHYPGALHAAEHAAISLFPFLALCDRGDIGGISVPLHPQLGTGAVFLYDGHPGGVGITARGFTGLRGLLARVRELLETCPCDAGCPSCVQSPKCGNGNRPLDKRGAARFLRLVLGDEAPEAVAAAPAVGSGAAAIEPLLPRRAAGPPEAAAADRDDPFAPEAFPEVPPPPRPAGWSRRALSILFDLETQRSAAEVGGWRNAHRMLVAVGVVCRLEDGEMEVFREDRVRDLVRALEAADVVIGFNVKRFDYRVLAGYTGIDYARRLPTLDLLEDVYRRVRFRLSMGDLARATLGVEKSADGLQSLEWVRAGRLDLVEAYCRHDVEILRDLYLHGRRTGYLLYRDREEHRLKLPVEW